MSTYGLYREPQFGFDNPVGKSPNTHMPFEVWDATFLQKDVRWAFSMGPCLPNGLKDLDLKSDFKSRAQENT